MTSSDHATPESPGPPRLRAAAALEARFRGFMEAAPDSMVIVNGDGRIVLANSQTERLFGYGPGELAGLTIEVLVPDRLRSTHVRHREGYVRDPRPRPMGEGMDLAAVRKDGTEFAAEISLSPLQTDEGRFFIAAVRDVSERKRLEKERRAALEEQNNLILEANRLKSEFLANMSHELRTPMNAILGFTQLMVDGKVTDPKEQKEFLGDILSSAQHLVELINEVLDLAKVEAGRLVLKREPVKMEDLVAEVSSSLQTVAVQAGVRLRTEVRKGVGRVEVDPSRTKQVLYNYLSNALKFTPRGGTVSLLVRTESRASFRIEVADTGLGIRKEDLPRLFRQYQQLEQPSARTHSGTGLGLFLTKRIVELHGGVVGVESEPGRGSTFFAVLPRKSGA